MEVISEEEIFFHSNLVWINSSMSEIAVGNINPGFALTKLWTFHTRELVPFLDVLTF